ncbi:MAG: HAMP domain-containing histidine kinase [Burkholderiaceae bacterium]|nr:HAMP domain-containing histidine kinase [Burkholderiaceae bacterium]
MTPRAWPAWLHSRWALATTLALMVLAIAVALGALALERQRLRGAASERAALFARVLEDQANRSFDAVALMLEAASADLATLPASDAAEAQAALARLGRQWQAALQGQPYLRSLSLVAADGRVLASSSADNIGRRLGPDHGRARLLPRSSERPSPERPLLGSLLAARDLADLAEPLAGAPAPAVPPTVLLLPMLRAHHISEGTPEAADQGARSPAAPAPSGWLVAAVHVDWFRQQYLLLAGDQALQLALLGYDGRLLAGSAGLALASGALAPRDPVFSRFLPEQEQGRFAGPGLDGRPVQAAFRSARRLPLLVWAEVPESAIDAELARLRRELLAVTLAVLAGIGTLGAVAWRSLRDHEATRAQLQAAQAEAQARSQQALAAAEDANAAKSEFIANISHELRTPLQTMLGFAELGVARPATPQRAQAMFSDIHAAGLRMLALVNNLLDLSRLESTIGPVRRQPVDLAPALAAVVAELQPLAERRGQRLLAPAEAQAPLWALADAFRLQQVLRNLLANAIRYAPEHSSIELDWRRDGDQLLLRVRDRGPGIPPDELEQIFDAFVQSSRTRDGAGGTGLGLAICRKIVQAHDGQIVARNAVGGGAEFEVRLPALPDAAPA